MALDVKVPAVGESVQEAMIHKWHVSAGDFVARDSVLLEIETDKATVEVTAEAEGTIEILKKEGETVGIGDVIARIDTAGAKPAGKAETKVPPPPPAAATAPAAKEAAPAAKEAAPATDKTLMPAAKRMVEQFNVNANAVEGTGKGGRVTKGDVIDHMEGKSSAPAAPAAAAPTEKPAKASEPAAKQPEAKMPVLNRAGHTRNERREPMSMLRRRIAERLVNAQQTAAILTTFNEVDMKAVMDLRKQYKDSFKEKHGVGLGFMSFFVKATVEALKQYPAINGWIEGNEIVYHDFYDIGVAVSSPRGLVVPVLRDTELMTMADVEKAIVFYGTKARDGKISVDDMAGGTFTISNGGVFGSLLSTPILNPPQSAILGMHKIQDRPMAI